MIILRKGASPMKSLMAACVLVLGMSQLHPLQAQCTTVWCAGGSGQYTYGYVGVGVVPIQPAFSVYSNTTGGGTLFNVDGGPSATGYRFVLQDQGANRFRIAPVGTTIIDAGGADPALIINYGGANPVAAQITGGMSVSGNVSIAANISVAGNIAAKYQDFAEWVQASTDIPPGTVVVLDSEHANRVMPSEHQYDTKVAGVVSEYPGVILGEAGKDRVKVATSGRVKVRVRADKPIHVGDLLVTSDEAGTAMASQPLDIGGVKIHRPGTLIGKALEPLATGEKEILVLLSLQ